MPLKQLSTLVRQAFFLLTEDSQHLHPNRLPVLQRTTNYKEEVLFQINHRTDLTTAHVIRYNGVLYDITRIDSFEGYKADLKLYAKRRVR